MTEPNFNLFIDPGHGGDDPGCTGGGIVEAELVFDLARSLLVRSMLLPTWAVALSRDRNEDPAPAVRDQRARAAEADFVLSIHADFGKPAWRGATIFHWATNRQTKRIAEELAWAMPRELRRGRRARMLGVPHESYPRVTAVVGSLTAPAVLAEVAFLTSANDTEYIEQPFSQDRIVAALFACACKAAQFYGRKNHE